MQGYDQFFKQARKASAQGQGARPQSARAQSTRVAQSGRKPRFTMSSAPETSPELKMKKILAAKMNEKKKLRASRRRPVPKGPLAAVVLGAVFATAGLLNPEAMDWVVEHVEIGVYGQAQAADTEKKGDQAEKQEGLGEKAADAKSADAAKAAAADGGTNGATKAEGVPDTRGWTQEELSFFNKLGERKRELDLREAELNKLEEELQKQRIELDEKIKQLEGTREQIAKTLKTRVDNDQAKVSKLVEVYSGMKPAQAAKVIETINEDLAVQVLDRMKKKSAANILNVMNADKAQRLSEMLAGYKRN
ncbi:MAG: hypothetical protein NDI61_02690 [Bdellovibrionaceae bacterium]|nr:hypothetical protein [Pseudobdellovibrionaceae bacterium]